MGRYNLIVYFVLVHNLSYNIINALIPNLHTKETLPLYIIGVMRSCIEYRNVTNGWLVRFPHKCFKLERAQQNGFIFRTSIEDLGYREDSYSWINLPKVNRKFVSISMLAYEINKELEYILQLK